MASSKGTTDTYKTRQRIRDFGEVFTADHEVRSMLDLVRYVSENEWSTVLEPACGTGNFLVEVLQRRIQSAIAKTSNQIEFEFMLLRGLTTTYGIDISNDNVIESRERLLHEVKTAFKCRYKNKKPSAGFFESVTWVLHHNIVTGDFINGLDKIVFIEYSTPKSLYFGRQEFKLIAGANQTEITLFTTTEPLKRYRITHYAFLCS